MRISQTVNLAVGCIFVSHLLWEIASFRMSYRNSRFAHSTNFLDRRLKTLDAQHSLHCSYPIWTIECNDAYRHASMHHNDVFPLVLLFQFSNMLHIGRPPHSLLQTHTHIHISIHRVLATDFSTKSEIGIGLSDIYCYCCEKSIWNATKKRENMLKHIRCEEQNFKILKKHNCLFIWKLSIYSLWTSSIDQYQIARECHFLSIKWKKVYFPWKIIHFLCQRYLHLRSCATCVCVCIILRFWLRCIVQHHRGTDFIIHWAFAIFCWASNACRRVPPNDQTKTFIQMMETERRAHKKKVRYIFNAQMHLHEHLHVHNTPIILLVKRAQNSNMWSGDFSFACNSTHARARHQTQSEPERWRREKKVDANYRNKEIKNRLDSYLCEIPIHLLCAGNCITNWCWVELTGNSMAQLTNKLIKKCTLSLRAWPRRPWAPAHFFFNRHFSFTLD